MPSETGIWSAKEGAENHVFDYELAHYLGQMFRKQDPVIDVGCGRGTYLRYFHDIGFEKLAGIEGSDQVFKFGNAVPFNKHMTFGNVGLWDLSNSIMTPPPISGNVICLEVGEHIPEQYEDIFIDNLIKLTSSGGYIILSWAVPGQDGIGHVNCKHNIWVIEVMTKRGVIFCPIQSLSIRTCISNHTAWFRNSIMIFQKSY